MKNIYTWWFALNAQLWDTPRIFIPKGLSSRQAFFYCETYEVRTTDTSTQIAGRYDDTSQYVFENQR